MTGQRVSDEELADLASNDYICLDERHRRLVADLRAAREESRQLRTAAADMAELLGERYLTERDAPPTSTRRRANRDYDDGYRMAMEDAARIARHAAPERQVLPE